MESQARADDEKLATLRKLAADGFGALDRGEAATIEGSEELAAFIGRSGKRAAHRAERRFGAGKPGAPVQGVPW
jgi:hypothetical protein